MNKQPFPSRREFLKHGVAGLAGAALYSSSSCSRSSQQDSKSNGALAVRTLGRTGLRLPVVSMGTSYGINLVRVALDEGIVYFHTSSSYAEKSHERLLGQAFQGLPRDSFVIGTSPDLPYGRGESGQGLSLDVGPHIDPALISSSIEGSLQRLGLDHVDIYYLASVGTRESTLHEPYLREFEAVKKAGKARFVGVVTHSHEPEVIRAAVESDFWDVVLTAYNFRQSHRDQVREAIGDAAKAGLGVVAMKTQAGVYWDRARLRQIDMKAALKWVLQDENVHTAIPAFANFDEMREDISVMEDLELTSQERRRLRLGAALGLPGFFCQQCGSCVSQCSAGVDLPTLMRSRMYVLGHRDPAKARRTLRSWKPTDVACTRCARCEVHCPLGLDVRSGALEMAQLLEVPEDFLA